MLYSFYYVSITQLLSLRNRQNYYIPQSNSNSKTTPSLRRFLQGTRVGLRRRSRLLMLQCAQLRRRRRQFIAQLFIVLPQMTNQISLKIANKPIKRLPYLIDVLPG